MRRRIRSELAAAARARDLCRDHPFTDPAHVAVATELGEHVTRAEQVAIDESVGRRLAAGGTEGRKASRREINDHLRVVTRMAALVAAEHPELAAQLKAPTMSAPIGTVISRGWAIHQVVKANAELLSGFGLGADLVDRLGAAITRFEAELARTSVGRAQHVAARADLTALTARISDLIGLLDAVNRIRFKDNAGLLAAWTSARNIVGPGTVPAPDPTDPPVDPSKPGATKAG